MSETKNCTGRRRTLLPWMGGKSRLAAQIIALLPEHTTYVEPFCGGCAVFLRKPRSKAEILNDADNRLITLLRVFRYHPDELQKEIAYLTHSRAEFRDALAQPGITDIQKAARFLLVVKAGFGSKLSSPAFGYGLTERANFTQEGDRQSHRRRAVVSLNDCPDTRRLYDGWDIRELGVTYSVGGKGVDRKKTERGSGDDKNILMRDVLLYLSFKAILN